MSEIAKAQREINVLIRSLQQMKTDNSFWDDFLERSGHIIVSEAKKRVPVDRGSLRRAISHRVTKQPLGLEVGVLGGAVKGVPYGALQEFGGRITGNPWLTIPLEEKYRDRSPRQFDLTFVSLGGTKFMLDRATGEMAYVLKKSVTIKAQPYLQPAIEVYRRRNFDKLLNKMLKEFFGGL